MQCDHYVACPYYIGHKVIDGIPIIKCEGIESSRIATRVSFKDKHSREEYKEHFCTDLYRCKMCPIHQALDRKYGVEDV